MFGWFKKEKLASNLNKLFSNKDYTKIIEMTGEAIDQKMATPYAHTFRIWALVETKQIEKAFDACQLALSLYPNNAVFMSLSGEILYRLDRYEDAQKILKEALEISPSNLQIEYMLGLTYVAQGQLEEASEYFDSILRYDPTLLQTRLLAMAEHHAFLARKDR